MRSVLIQKLRDRFSREGIADPIPAEPIRRASVDRP